MAMKNEYILVIADKIDLAGMVVNNLNEGFELVGGVTSTYNPDCKKVEYCQAMIKKHGESGSMLL